MLRVFVKVVLQTNFLSDISRRRALRGKRGCDGRDLRNKPRYHGRAVSDQRPCILSVCVHDQTTLADSETRGIHPGKGVFEEYWRG